MSRLSIPGGPRPLSAFVRSNFDLTWFRNFNLGSDKRVLTFRAEAYNVLNHTQLNSIDTTAVSERDNRQSDVRSGPRRMACSSNAVLDAIPILGSPP